MTAANLSPGQKAARTRKLRTNARKAVATRQTYSIFVDLKEAGWFRNFNTSEGGHLCMPVDGAPSLGSSRGELLFAGSWTAPDGTTLFQRSNMDRSWTSVVIDPLGNIVHVLSSKTLAESGDHLQMLNIV
jgi:hypothetical protein